MILKAFLGHYETLGDAFLTTFSSPFLLEEGLLEEEGRSQETRQVHYLQQDEAPFVIGRKPQADIRILDRNVSGRHAQILPPAGGQGWRITDLGSSNGTFVNGEQLQENEPRPLQDEAVIGLGPVTCYVYMEPQTFLTVLRQVAAKQAGEAEKRPKPSARTTERDAGRTLVGGVAKSSRETSSLDPAAGLFLFCEPFDPVPLAPGDKMVIGRSAAHADVVLPHPKISRRHAEIECRPEGVYVRDLHSANGIFMGSTQLPDREIPWPIGKPIRIADFSLVVRGELPKQNEDTFVLKPKSKRRIIKGDLSKTSLGDLLVVIEEKQKSGSLQITNQNFGGWISFHAGKPYRATTNSNLVGVEAIRELLRLTEGSFMIDPNAKQPGVREIKEGFSDLVLENFLD